MQTRRPLAVLAVASIAFAACGDDEAPSLDTSSATETPADSAAPPETEAPTDTPVEGDDQPSAAGYEHPTGADEVVVSLADVGGFMMARFSFSMAPRLIISGDGLAYTPAATTAIFPGVLVPPMQVQTISEEGIQAVLAAADEAGLFAEIDYEDESTQLIADASTTVLTITADGETWEHSAYALGLDLPASGEELSPERQSLQSFLDELSDLTSLAGAENLGEPELYVPDAYEIVATPVDDPSSLAVDGIEPTVVEWPASAEIALADAAACTRIAAAGVGEVFEEANELTLFSQGEVTYEVWVRPALPGRTCTS